jgi:hypothetical protein
MQIYPLQPGFTSGQSITLCVQPNSRFSLDIYRQTAAEALKFHSGISVSSTSDVSERVCRVGTRTKMVFQSAGNSAAKSFNEDWGWPRITLKPTGEAPESGAYVVVAYEVDNDGTPTTDLGRTCHAEEDVLAVPPQSDSMALVICRPGYVASTTRLAYIVPIATYHAYNSTGGGCFYDDHIHGTTASTKVSLRRPGGGLGAKLGEPTDPYDPGSPRQQFTHWDAKFIRWLISENLACDFYTDLDLHDGEELDLTDYKCMLSVGHHEYWSQAMRDHVSNFIGTGGNVGVFSGNTCFRPVDFGAFSSTEHMKVINKKADHWTQPDYNESQLLGLSYGFGGGKWGDWVNGDWTNTTRNATGFIVQQANHWVFNGCGLSNNQTFGANDRLVGYEADGIPTTSNGFKVLAKSPQLTGWDVGGVGAMGIFGTESTTGDQLALVFNCGTTDWARVLMDPNAQSNAVVKRITHNVVKTFIHQTP